MFLKNIKNTIKQTHRTKCKVSSSGYKWLQIKMLFFVNFLFNLTFFTHTVKNDSVSNNIRIVTCVVTVGLIMATAFCQIMSKIYYITYKLSWNLEQNVRCEILFAWPIKILNRWKSGSKNKITYCQDKYHRSHKGPDCIGLHIEPAMIVCFVFVHGYHQGYSNNQNRHTWKQVNNRTIAHQIILWVILL